MSDCLTFPGLVRYIFLNWPLNKGAMSFASLSAAQAKRRLKSQLKLRLFLSFVRVSIVNPTLLGVWAPSRMRRGILLNSTGFFITSKRPGRNAFERPFSIISSESSGKAFLTAIAASAAFCA